MIKKSEILEIKNEISLLEERYKAETNKDHRKNFGQFFTPQLVADWMAKWVLASPIKIVLEPSVGMGSLAISIIENDPNCKVIAIEKDPIIFSKINQRLRSLIELRNIDFFDLDETTKFDGVISNPPYIRHHSLSLKDEIYSRLEGVIKEKISKLTNIYILFCIDLIDRLEDGGRAAIIIPTEWMNSNFGESFKKYLYKTNYNCTIVYVSNDALVFDDALTTASILLIEKKKNTSASVKFKYVKNKKYFSDFCPDDDRYVLGFEYGWDELLSIKKWDSLFGRQNLVGNQENLISLGDICSSKRGIATGANKYFHLSKSSVNAHHISPNSIKKCIGSAADVRGLIFDQSDLSSLIENDKRIFLFDPDSNVSSGDEEYIRHGESLGINKGFLTSARKVWYQQERRSPAPIWVGVFNRDKIKFIYNESGAYNLTTFHCLYPKVHLSENQIKALVAILNHQDMSAYVMEQRRVYGGGLLKLEPRDLPDIRIPDIRSLTPEMITLLSDELVIANNEIKSGKKYQFQFDLKEILEIKKHSRNMII